MVRYLFLLAIVLVQSPLHATSETVESERFERWTEAQRLQRAFEHKQFSEVGFPSIAEAQVQGRDLRRALINDPYRIIHLPGLEFERHDDGRVTLRVQFLGWSREPVEIDRERWDEFAALETDVFAPPEYDAVATSGRTPPPRRGVCHGWIVRFTAALDKTESWSQCGGKPGPARNYAIAMIDAAISTRKDCEFESDRPFWSFSECFQAKAELDDPELSARFAEIRAAYHRATSSEELAEARLLIRDTDFVVGDQDWFAARAAVDRVRAKDAERQRLLQRLRKLLADSKAISKADRVRLTRTISHWGSQERELFLGIPLSLCEAWFGRDRQSQPTTEAGATTMAPAFSRDHCEFRADRAYAQRLKPGSHPDLRHSAVRPRHR